MIRENLPFLIVTLIMLAAFGVFYYYEWRKKSIAFYFILVWFSLTMLYCISGLLRYGLTLKGYGIFAFVLLLTYTSLYARYNIFSKLRMYILMLSSALIGGFMGAALVLHDYDNLEMSIVLAFLLIASLFAKQKTIDLKETTP